MQSRERPFKAIGILALGSLLWAAAPVQAVPVTYTFMATVFSGPLTGIYGTGNFTFDESLIENAPIDTSGYIDTAAGLILNFTISGTLYTGIDDVEYATYPFLVFDKYADYVLYSIQFTVGEALIDNMLVEGFFLFNDLVSAPDTAFDFTTELNVIYSASPTPGTLVLVPLGVGILWARRRVRWTLMPRSGD